MPWIMPVVTAQVSQQNLFGRGQILSLKASHRRRSSTTLRPLLHGTLALRHAPLEQVRSLESLPRV
ncbi:MAG: hypothetical protein MZV70_48615 [Desulfobacterales bacterium]|nr:hypothetical protein [Desulfobacterales bacterium]